MLEPKTKDGKRVCRDCEKEISPKTRYCNDCRPDCEVLFHFRDGREHARTV